MAGFVREAFPQGTCVCRFPEPTVWPLTYTRMSPSGRARTCDLPLPKRARSQLRYRPMQSEICTYYTRYRAYRQVLKARHDQCLMIRFSDLLLTGEFSQLYVASQLPATL